MAVLATLSFIFLGPIIATAATAQRGAIHNIGLSPSPAVVGAPVTATVTGTNPCGAVFIDWGDGTAITYPISTVPAAQSYTYKAGGHFTVVAKGMGNCDGEVKTVIEVKGPATPPPSATREPAITSVEFAPSPAFVRQPVDIVVKGRGACAFAIDFDDGNTHQASGVLPQTVKHTYSVADTYVVIVRSEPPCAGRFTQKLAVVASPPPPQILSVEVSPSRGIAGRPVTIDIVGTGTCTYAIDFGDGNTETRTAKQLPDRVAHNYPAPDTYTIEANAQAPCAGRSRTSVVIRSRRGSM